MTKKLKIILWGIFLYSMSYFVIQFPYQDTYEDRLKSWLYNSCYDSCIPDSLMPVSSEDTTVYVKLLSWTEQCF